MLKTKQHYMDSNTKTTKKAVRVQIYLGNIPFNVYQLSDGSYKLAGRNVTSAIGDNNHKSLGRELGVKSLKHLPNANQSLGQIKAETGESFIPVAIEDAVSYWVIKSQKGNKIASSILGSCAIEAIERRADKALGKEVSEKERNERLELRMRRLQARHEWTDILRDRSLELFGEKPTPEKYRQWTVKVNNQLFNQPHFWRDRDNMEDFEQITITNFEFMAKRRAKQHPQATPDELVELALDTF